MRSGNGPTVGMFSSSNPGGRGAALLAALFAFLLIFAFGEIVLHDRRQEATNKRHLQALSQAAALRTQIERELNSILYLSYGLDSYLTIRRGNTRGPEIDDVLAVLYRNSRHVRNFALATGFRVDYVYPREGNEKAIGLHYPDNPAQWPVVKRIVETGKPILAGPLPLVQGGKGLIYRVPLFVGGNYWGLLSIVIDSDSFFKAVLRDAENDHYLLALRGQDGSGLEGEIIWGDPSVFRMPNVGIQEIDVPGGRWALAAVVKDDDGTGDGLFIRFLSVACGALMGWMIYTLVSNREQMTRLALFDNLTGLPNRLLFEDRMGMALARQQRRGDKLCAVLFLDLDNFKAINDEHGHKAGDEVLRVTAERARRAVRRDDTIARWGGDEFIVLLENISEEMLAILVRRLRANLEVPIRFEDHRLNVGVSIGIATLHEEAGVDEILKTADQRMYDDKMRRKRNP